MRTSRILTVILAAALVSCSGNIEISDNVQEQAPIWPDYSEVTVPANIAPLDFSCMAPEKSALIVNGTKVIKGRKGLFRFSRSEWKKLTSDDIDLVVAVRKEGKWIAYKPFKIYVSKDEIDPFVSYRLIPPGYQGWKRMGLYQRNLASYSQTAIYENKLGSENCVNCHTPCNRDPERTVFHARADFGGTLVSHDGIIEKLNTKTDSTISALVYPFWHPSGKYIAFSVNSTKQSFFAHDPNRIEVFDAASDVVVYDVESHQIAWSPLTKTADNFETFPAFSPDGKYLYFCSTKAVENMPADYDKAKYDLKRIAFDEGSMSFGDSLETVYDASSQDMSVSFPRISPDGKHLAFTLHSYGNFSIWHKDADIWMTDLSTGESWPLDGLNSEDVDSYHSWSGNSRWLLFSSRRDDGLYTRLYIAHIDENGKASKAFLMPQKNPVKYYKELMFSYNVPELMTGKVRNSSHDYAMDMRNDKGIDVTVKK